MDDLPKQQFDFERAAARRLLSASQCERPALYLSIYAEYFRKFGASGSCNDGSARKTRHQVAFLKPFMRNGVNTFMEFGSGNGHVCVAMSAFAKRVIGVDIAANRDAPRDAPANCHFVTANITSRLVEDGTVDVLYSSQVLEHLHPDDCVIVVRNAFAALKPGGLFINIVPNWLTGPHDISKYFVNRAEGLHLHEYDNRELSKLLCESGFESCQSYVGTHSICFPLPSKLVGALETVSQAFPQNWRKNIIMRGLTGVRMAARKP